MGRGARTTTFGFILYADPKLRVGLNAREGGDKDAFVSSCFLGGVALPGGCALGWLFRRGRGLLFPGGKGA